MRWFLPLLLLSLPATVPVAEAGIGSLLKAAAKIGSVGGKAGKLAKGASALKGAKLLGAGVAAERVFAHAASGSARVGVFVADDGAGALKVVMQGGDELSHSPSGLRTLLDDLDEMAEVAPDAGVDLYLDGDVVARLAELDVGPNTRLWLANTAGPSLPLRQGATGVAEVGLGGTGLGPRIWLRLLGDIGQHAALLGGQAFEADEVATLCGDGAFPAGAGGTVVLLTDGALSDAEAYQLALEHDVDLVVLGLAGVCAPGAASELAAAREAVTGATTLAELWSVGATAADPRVVAQVQQRADHLLLVGPGLAAVHAVAAVPDDEGPPFWAMLLVCLAAAGFVAYRIRRFQAAPGGD